MAQPSLAELPWVDPGASVAWVALDAIAPLIPCLALYDGLLCIHDGWAVVPLFRHLIIPGCRRGWRWHRCTVDRLLTHDLPLARHAANLKGVARLQLDAMRQALSKARDACVSEAPGGLYAWDNLHLTFTEVADSGAGLLFAGVRYMAFDCPEQRIYLELDNSHCLVLEQLAAWTFARAAWLLALPTTVLAPLARLCPDAVGGVSPFNPVSSSSPEPLVKKPARSDDTERVAISPNPLGVVALDVTWDTVPRIVRVCFVWTLVESTHRWEVVPESKSMLGLWGTLPALLPLARWRLEAPDSVWQLQPRDALADPMRGIIAATTQVTSPSPTLQLWTLDVYRLIQSRPLGTTPASFNITVSWVQALDAVHGRALWVPLLDGHTSGAMLAATSSQTPSIRPKALLAATGLSVDALGQMIESTSPLAGAIDFCSKAIVVTRSREGAWNVPLAAAIQDHGLLRAVQRALRRVGIDTCVMLA